MQAQANDIKKHLLLNIMNDEIKVLEQQQKYFLRVFAFFTKTSQH